MGLVSELEVEGDVEVEDEDEGVGGRGWVNVWVVGELAVEVDV